mmetsp:Transcript_70793/g.169552  ORF Transcript_70793/g.169552 Transcript_70793/m.169552 type:complete len:82 (-) Transcript_70793:96-341(-)
MWTLEVALPKAGAQGGGASSGEEDPVTRTRLFRRRIAIFVVIVLIKALVVGLFFVAGTRTTRTAVGNSNPANSAKPAGGKR